METPLPPQPPLSGGAPATTRGARVLPLQRSLARLARTADLDRGYRRVRREIAVEAGERLLRVVHARGDGLGELLDEVRLANQILGERWRERLATRPVQPTPLSMLNSRFD